MHQQARSALNIERWKDWNIEPKVTDRVDAVGEAGASEQTREVKIEPKVTDYRDIK